MLPEIKGMAWKISVAAGFLSILFVVFIALVLSRINATTSAAIAFSIAVVYTIFRMKTESPWR